MKKIFTLIAFFIVGGIAAQDLQEGLVLHYPFDGNLTEAISGITADNNGNLTFAEGQSPGSQAVLFFNEDAYILTPRETLQVGLAADGGTAGTYAMFVNHRAEPLLTDRQNYIAQKNGCGSEDKNRGRVDLYRQSPTNGSDPDSLISFLGGKPHRTNYKLDMADTWIHLALTFDPEAEEWAFFVDGVEVRRDSILAQAENSCGEYVLGHHLTFTTGTQTFDGKMDDVRFYNRVLMQEEITMLAAGAGISSTKEEFVTNAVKLSPNPVGTNQPINLTIDNSIFSTGSSVIVNVFDATGRKVLENNYDNLSDQMTLEHALPAGLFTLSITDGERISNMKFVVQ